MAKLIDAVRLIEKPKNTPMFIEYKGVEEFKFEVAWKYDEEIHSVCTLGSRIVYDIDGYNRRWRAWDTLPTTQEREAAAWLPEEAR